MINNICIVRLSALGDVVLMVPMVRTLQQAFPNARITWITSKASHLILDGLSGVQFKIIDKPSSLKDYWQFKREMRDQRFDVLIASQASLRANLLYPLIKADLKIGFDNQRSKDGHRFFVNQQIPFAKQHLLESFLSFAHALGAQPSRISWDLAIDEQDYQFAKQAIVEKDYIAINPAASKQERNWLIERYAELIERCHQQWSLPVVLTGGPSEQEKQLTQSILKQLNGDAKVIDLVGKTTPKQLAAVLDNAMCLISPDTGPAHIAAAMHTPVIGLYAVAPAQLSGPYTSPQCVIDKFDQAVRECLGKNPDKVAWGTRVHDQRAMALITVDDVIEKLQQVLP